MSRRTPIDRPLPATALMATLIGCSTAGAAPPPDKVFQTEAASFRVTEVAGGLSHPWGLAFLPDGRMLVTERGGQLRLIDEGRLTEEEASSHPQRSLILHALNGSDVEPDLSIREVRIGDRYLLCSDGLSDVVSPDTLLEALRHVS